jgi:negative regulator of replication initiation
VNDDGTKTMTTDGTKTIYSWDEDKGDITQKTETVKRYSDVLENPLNELDDQIKKIEKLLDSKKFQSHKKSKHQDILVNTLEVLHEIQRNGLEHSLGKLEPVRSDFHAHVL